MKQLCLRLQCLVEYLKVDTVFRMHLISTCNLRALILGEYLVLHRPHWKLSAWYGSSRSEFWASIPNNKVLISVCGVTELLRTSLVQDDEYLASLQADREKAEARRLMEEEARNAALAEERRKEEETRRKMEEQQVLCYWIIFFLFMVKLFFCMFCLLEWMLLLNSFKQFTDAQWPFCWQEYERQLAAKEASLPQEPAPDDENAVTLLVRMPDGSRRGRRFLKSNKLQVRSV